MRKLTMLLFSPSLRTGLPVLILAMLLIVSTVASAQTNKEIAEFAGQLDKIDRSLKKRTISNETFTGWLSRIAELRSASIQCVNSTETELKKLTESITSLGEKSRKEPVEVRRKRASLDQEKQKLDNQLSRCKLIILRSDEISQSITERQKLILAQRLLARGADFFTLLKESGQQPAIWLNTTRGFIAQHSGITRLANYQLLILAFVVFLVGFATYLIRRNLFEWAGRKVWYENFGGNVLQSFVYSYSHYLPQFFVTGLLALSLYGFARGVSPVPFVNVVFYALPVYIFMLASLRFIFSPPPPAGVFIELESALARALYQRLRVLLNLFLIAYLLFSTILTQSLPETAVLLARGVIGLFLILNLIWVVLLLGRLPRFANKYWPRLIMFLLLFSILVTEWFGYRNLALFSLRALIGSLVVIGFFVLLHKLFREFFIGFDKGSRRWHRVLRQAIGVRDGEHVPGLIWFKLVVNLCLWIAMAYLVLRIWGLSDAVEQQIRIALFDGFTLGSLKIIPVRIFLAIVSFALLYTFSGWLRARLERTWLTSTRIERGTREAIVTITGYSLIAIAILIVLGIAGVEFTNLAIIAGALSVGIGFGLQNIVNNFVSGLILLFERPIKTGDWIVVGGTEGYVRKIRMRSTQIQTFDRADVIVPNSELIASQVTNWMLQDVRGRIRVPVGVAYGSDVEKVRDVMLQVAEEHEGIINNDPDLKPVVLFRGFGDSALDFELRAHIQNIDKRLQVISDINFAINKLFQDNHIEIPFPQRDLHVKNWPGKFDRDTD